MKIIKPGEYVLDCFCMFCPLDPGSRCFQGVQDQLQNVQAIQASFGAFAALLSDGSVVTWGDPQDGGDSSAVKHQLKKVRWIQGIYKAFVAGLNDGSLVTWGDPKCDASALAGHFRLL